MNIGPNMERTPSLRRLVFRLRMLQRVFQTAHVAAYRGSLDRRSASPDPILEAPRMRHHKHLRLRG